MSEELDKAADGFANEIAPPSRPRDVAGKFVQTVDKPEPMFVPREVEGGPDAGEDPRRRAREVEVQRDQTRRQQTDLDDVHGAVDTGPERVGARDADGGDEGELTDEERAVAEGRSEDVAERRPREGEDDERYEVIVDGQPQEVSLGEALNGYVRQETFHKRLGELTQLRNALDEDSRRQQDNWQMMIRAKEEYENDVRTMMPPEPDWDREFAINPTEAHRQQKIFQGLYAKLAQSQQERAQMAALAAQNADRQLEKYAVDGFSRFVFESKIPDEATLRKEIQSMRKTAFAAGFSEQEVATVYDHRMLSILRRASKYDRMMAAAKPQAVVPGRGRSVPPGAATPLGNAPRRGFDEASRRLAATGSMDDAAEVFRRIL